jgi:hypothetical protein
MTLIKITYEHQHGCPDRGRVTTRRLALPEDDMRHPVCTHPGVYCLSELTIVGVEEVPA